MNDYPDLSLFLQNLWMKENAEGLKAIEGKGGYRDGKYFPYKTKNGNTDIGPGFDMEHQTPEFRKRAVKGFTKEELDSIVLDRAQKEIPNLKRRIVKEGGNPDKVSDNVYNGLLDMYWQIDNGLYKYNNLWKGVAQGDYEKIRNESATYYDSKNGKIPKNATVKNGKILDSGRWEFRKNTYFKEPEEPVVSSKEMPISTEPTLPVVTVDPTPIHREYTDAIRSYRQPVTPSNTKRDAYKAMQDKVNFNRFMDSISIQNTLPPAYEPQSNLHSEGGQMETVKLWEELSIPEKAAMMRVAVKNGITNLQDIKREYNEFAKGGPKKKPSVNGNAQRAMDYFMNKGLSQHQAAGLVGNLMRESGMSPTAVNSSSGAYGLAQWLGSRKKALFNKYGNNPTLNQQLDFVWNELNSTHKKGLKALKSSKSAEEAARNAMGYYEFMAGPDAAVREMRKYGQDGEGSMRKGINYASILMGHSPSKSPIVPITPIAPINPSISQESLESPIPFTPFNPEALFATPDTYQQPIVVEDPETQEPVAISPYSPEEIDRQERINRLSAFNRILSLTNPYSQEEDSFLSTIGLLTGNTYSKGGGIHIKPSHRGRLTELKKRTGKSEAELYKTGGPAVRKMITFARNARKWKHGLGGNLYDEGGSYSYTKPLDNVFVDDEGNLLDPEVPSARGTVQLPEIIASTRDPRKPIHTTFSKDLNDAIFNISRRLMQYGRNKSVLAPTNTEFNIIDNEPIESMAQATYLTPRNIQKQKFLEVGYTEAPRDYGLVKKAVGDRNIPVYQKRPDDEKRENLIAIGNIDTEWFGKDRAELRHAGSYPTAVYINPENSKVYQKAWDLNDYGGNTGTATAYSPMRKLEANIIDKIGSPVVVTSGISEVDNENIKGSLESVLDDFMYNKGLTRYRDYIKEEIPMNIIHGEPMYNPDGTRVYMTDIKPFTYYGLPEVTVYGKMKKGTTYLLTPSIISKKK